LRPFLFTFACSAIDISFFACPAAAPVARFTPGAALLATSSAAFFSLLLPSCAASPFINGFCGRAGRVGVGPLAAASCNRQSPNVFGSPPRLLRVLLLLFGIIHYIEKNYLHVFY
jgi:hypothetical protein